MQGEDAIAQLMLLLLLLLPVMLRLRLWLPQLRLLLLRFGECYCDVAKHLVGPPDMNPKQVVGQPHGLMA